MIIEFTSEVLATPVFKEQSHGHQAEASGWSASWGAQAAAGILFVQKYHKHTCHLPPASVLDKPLAILSSWDGYFTHLRKRLWFAVWTGTSRPVLESSFQDVPLCFIFGFSSNISSCTSKSLMPLNSLSNSTDILGFSFLFKKYLQLTAPMSILLFCNLEVLNIDLITTLPPLPIGVLLHW